MSHLVKILYTILLFLVSQVLIGQEQTRNYFNFLNPYHSELFNKQPMDYYGSGDVNHDGVIDEMDVQSITEGISNDRADVNGDGIVSMADGDLIQSYVLGEIPYLPGHWNHLETAKEREEWLKKVLEIDDANSIHLGKSCGYFANQLAYDCHDVENILEWEEYDSQNRMYGLTNRLGRFNIPMYVLSSRSSMGEAHAANAIFIGSDVPEEDTPLSFKVWRFIEPQNDAIVQPGGFTIDPNKPIEIRRTIFKYNSLVEEYYHNETLLIIFNLNEGIPSLDYFKEDILTSRPSISDIENNIRYKNISTTIYPNPTNSNVTIEYSCQASGKEIITLMDKMGRVLESHVLDPSPKIAGSFHLNLASYPPGVYFVKIGNQTIKIIKH
jgi:hypothetical protein